MKKNDLRYVWIFISLVCFCSCEQTVSPNKNNYRTWLNPDVKLDNVFSVSLNIRVLFDDQFKIYYTEDDSSNFNEDRTINTKVKGLNLDQIVTFKFPKDIHPTNIRIDFGRNKNQKIFKLNSLKIGYENNDFNIPSFRLFTYFNHIEDQLSFNSKSKTLNVIKNKNEDKYLPIIWSNKVLSGRLKKLSKESKNNSKKIETVIEYTKEEFAKLISNSVIKNNIESFTYEENYLMIKGWAYFQNINSKDTKIQLLLFDNSTGHFIETTDISRPDVTAYFKLDYNADNSGFLADLNLDYFPKGNYILGVWLKNEKENKEGLFFYKEEIIIE